MYAGTIKSVNLKLDHFYGPNDSSIKFVARTVEQLRNNVTEINLTEGSQTRDFIYITDVLSAFDCILSNTDKLSDEHLNTFEAGSDNKTSIKQMVMTIKELTGNTSTRLNFGAIPYRAHEILEYELNTTALRLLGWRPEITNVRDGIKLILQEENKG